MLKRIIQKFLLNWLFTKQHQFYMVRAMDARKQALAAVLNKVERKSYLDSTLFDLRHKKSDELREDIEIYQSLIDAIIKTNEDAKDNTGS